MASYKLENNVFTTKLATYQDIKDNFNITLSNYSSSTAYRYVHGCETTSDGKQSVLLCGYQVPLYDPASAKMRSLRNISSNYYVTSVSIYDKINYMIPVNVCDNVKIYPSLFLEQIAGDIGLSRRTAIYWKYNIGYYGTEPDSYIAQCGYGPEDIYINSIQLNCKFTDSDSVTRLVCNASGSAYTYAYSFSSQVDTAFLNNSYLTFSGSGDFNTFNIKADFTSTGADTKFCPLMNAPSRTVSVSGTYGSNLTVGSYGYSFSSYHHSLSNFRSQNYQYGGDTDSCINIIPWLLMFRIFHPIVGGIPSIYNSQYSNYGYFEKNGHQCSIVMSDNASTYGARAKLDDNYYGFYIDSINLNIGVNGNAYNLKMTGNANAYKYNLVKKLYVNIPSGLGSISNDKRYVNSFTIQVNSGTVYTLTKGSNGYSYGSQTSGTVQIYNLTNSMNKMLYIVDDASGFCPRDANGYYSQINTTSSPGSGIANVLKHYST